MPRFSPAEEHVGGQGLFLGQDRFKGGIYVASTVDHARELWDALVHPEADDLLETPGDYEALRHTLPDKGTLQRAGELIWMTHRTPYQEHHDRQCRSNGKRAYRQTFRMVTSRISHWYAEHSTANPLVPLPSNVTIVHGSAATSGSSRR